MGDRIWRETYLEDMHRLNPQRTLLSRRLVKYGAEIILGSWSDCDWQEAVGMHRGFVGSSSFDGRLHTHGDAYHQ